MGRRTFKINKMILNPNCSESITKIPIKKSEIPYIKNRVKELMGYEDETVFTAFNEMVGKSYEEGDMMSESGAEAGVYERIKNEIISMREGSNLCPFCKEEIKEEEGLNNHIKDRHNIELVKIAKGIDEKELMKLHRMAMLEEIERNGEEN